MFFVLSGKPQGLIKVKTGNYWLHKQRMVSLVCGGRGEPQQESTSLRRRLAEMTAGVTHTDSAPLPLSPLSAGLC